MLNSSVLDNVESLAEKFQQAEPFRHVVIDDFFLPVFCESLLREFPTFETGNYLNESGLPGLKSVREDVPAIGPSYEMLDGLVKGMLFRNTIGRIAGVSKLIYDPEYYGGGTHENKHGQDLDPHVDFNFHPSKHWHRRLNLIVYLNKEWEKDWGGSIELHKDPHNATTDEIIEVAPAFNRAVLFETTESSWHGFRRINLPEDKQDLSRKSFALYYYTKKRPSDETADDHSTIYVERPLPDHIKPGHTLTEADYQEIQTLLTRRDQHLERLYGEIQGLMTNLHKTRRLLSPLYLIRRLFRRNR